MVRIEHVKPKTRLSYRNDGLVCTFIQQHVSLPSRIDGHCLSSIGSHEDAIDTVVDVFAQKPCVRIDKRYNHAAWMVARWPRSEIATGRWRPGVVIGSRPPQP